MADRLKLTPKRHLVYPVSVVGQARPLRLAEGYQTGQPALRRGYNLNLPGVVGEPVSGVVLGLVGLVIQNRIGAASPLCFITSG